jgi:Mitochondrial K+-H+ exchange-related
MRVFLIPVGPDRYDLYCEMPAEDALADQSDRKGGVFSRLAARVRRGIQSLERRQDEAGEQSRGLWQRVVARFGRLIAEAIAEQRLLWHLRNRTAATVVHPDDLPATSVMPIVRTHIQKDYEKHRFWLAFDMLLLAASALLTLLPGPNLIAYYFAFRVVGHFLSIRGARQALARIDWSLEPSTPLAELRRLLAQDAASRQSRLQAVASSLGLEHLPRFFDRVTAASA